MIYSLNEIDTHCKKAARGAKFDWGYAEDIGKTIRWLAAYNLPGTAVLAVYLKEYDHCRTNFCPPDIGDRAHFKSSNSGNLCPILTGTWLCDADVIEKNDHINFERLSFPLLMMPFLAQIAAVIQQTLTYEYQSTRLQFSNGILRFNNDPGVNCALTENAKITMDDKIIEGKPAAVVGQKTEKAHWDVLNQFAFNTYVPATEASRLGAGPSE